MKKLAAYIALLGLTLCLGLPFWVSGQGTISVWNFPATTTFSPTDILYIVLNPGSSPASRKITTSDLLKRARSCEIVLGSKNSGASALADTEDVPVACGNVSGADATITAAACFADAGSPTVTPILTGGSSTSILTGALTCGAGSWAAGTINGTPVIKSFSANGATCSVTPCTIDVNITSAGGTAKYAVVRLTIIN